MPRLSPATPYSDIISEAEADDLWRGEIPFPAEKRYGERRYTVNPPHGKKSSDDRRDSNKSSNPKAAGVIGMPLFCATVILPPGRDSLILSLSLLLCRGRYEWSITWNSINTFVLYYNTVRYQQTPAAGVRLEREREEG